MDLNFFRLIIDKGGCCSIDNRCIRCGEMGASCVVLLLDDEGGKGGVHSLSTAFEGAYSLSSIFGLALFALFFYSSWNLRRYNLFLGHRCCFGYFDFLRSR